MDQHAAEVRDALGGRLTIGALLSYAQGFVEAAVGRGWWPRQRTPLDWESLRLAAVCRLFLEAQASPRESGRDPGRRVLRRD